MKLLIIIILLSTVQVLAISNITRCFLCSLITNEVEGFTSENKTIHDVVQYAQLHICDKLPKVSQKHICDLIFDKYPILLSNEIKKWNVSNVCNKLHYCNHSLNVPHDFQSIPSYSFSLNTKPINRWNQICSDKNIKGTWVRFLNFLNKDLNVISLEIEKIGRYINSLLPSEYATEIYGCFNFRY